MGSSISIKQLHQATGEHVRRAAASRVPIRVTDRGKPVAALVNPSLLPLPRRRRTLLAEYKALISRKQQGDVLADLDAVRGDR
jgi:prevent-host-death family protein